MEEFFLGRALEYARARNPEASEGRIFAFAHAVAALVNGFSLGLAGGPTVREYVAVRMYGQEGFLAFETAMELLVSADGPMFGPLTDLHRQVWSEEYCFGDDPDDVRELSGKNLPDEK